MGREEGLTGHYTLRGVKQKSVEVLCWARNAAGTQAAPCRLTVYTQGKALNTSGWVYAHDSSTAFL